MMVAIRAIKWSTRGAWVPGQLVGTAKAGEEAKQKAAERAARTELGVVIDYPDGTYDWGDRVTTHSPVKLPNRSSEYV